MKNPELSTYINKLQNDQIKYLKLYQKDGEPEDLHQFRLCYKRLNALNCFLEFALDQKQKLNSLQIKQIYKSSGTIRDLHIKQNLWESIKNKPQKFSSIFIEELNSSALTQNAIFENTVKDNLLLTPILPTFKIQKLDEEIRLYTHKLSDEISSLFNSITCYDNFHQLRRDVKQLFYIMRIFNLKSKDIPLGKSPKKLKTIETLLGVWHDWVVLDERVSTFYFLNKHHNIINSRQFKELKFKILTQQKFTLTNAIKTFKTD